MYTVYIYYTFSYTSLSPTVSYYRTGQKCLLFQCFPTTCRVSVVGSSGSQPSRHCLMRSRRSV